MFLIRVTQDTELYDPENRLGAVTRRDKTRVRAGTELLATFEKPFKGSGSWWGVPFNGGVWMLILAHATKVRPSGLSTSDADDENTMLFTCHWCGNWLKQGDEGYGTRQGWCGCEEEQSDS